MHPSRRWSRSSWVGPDIGAASPLQRRLPIVLVAIRRSCPPPTSWSRLDSEAVRTLVELALSILLFADATRITAGRYER